MDPGSILIVIFCLTLLLLSFIGFLVTVWMALSHYVFPFFGKVAGFVGKVAGRTVGSVVSLKPKLKPFNTVFMLGITIAVAFVVIGIAYGFNAHQLKNSIGKIPSISPTEIAKQKTQLTPTEHTNQKTPETKVPASTEFVQPVMH